MRRIDLRKDLRRFYAPPPGVVELIDVPALRFLMVDGAVAAGEQPGDSTAFREAVGALYAVAYTLKFRCRERPVDPVDFPVMALEGLWPAEIAAGPTTGRADPWPFTLMILEPDAVGPADLADAIEAVRAKRDPGPALARLRLDDFCEGLCVQALHVGPYATEAVTIARMQAVAAAEGLRPSGRHHEIYLGDPRRAAPERLRTVLRQPVAREEPAA